MRSISLDIERVIANVRDHHPVYSNPIEYDGAIRVHPFFKEMRMWLANQVNDATIAGSRVLEIGPGTGQLTDLITENQQCEFHLIEPDPACASFLETRYKTRSNVLVRCEDFLSCDLTEKYSVVVSTAAEHHFSLESKQALYDKIASILNDDGVYLVGDELIAEYGSIERNECLFSFHATIIKLCLEHGHFLTAELEAIALKNGLVGFDEYKLSATEYAGYLKQAGLVLNEWKLLGPGCGEIGGVYVGKGSRNRRKTH